MRDFSVNLDCDIVLVGDVDLDPLGDYQASNIRVLLFGDILLRPIDAGQLSELLISSYETYLATRPLVDTL